MWIQNLFVTFPHSTSLIPPHPVSIHETNGFLLYFTAGFNISTAWILLNNWSNFKLEKRCSFFFFFLQNEERIHIKLCYVPGAILVIKRILTVYMTLAILNFPLRIHPERFVSLIKQKMADWTAPKEEKIAVLEYWRGYLLPILACTRNQEAHTKHPAIKNILLPMAQLSVLLVEIIM